MAQNLLIVESPSKAKTIERFLKELKKPFVVSSCFGHIRDLKKKNMGIDFAHNYAPEYEIPSDKKEVVQRLKAKVKTVKEVWLATDEDREGESISWHLCEVLGLDLSKTKRIVFHEITKSAIEHSIANPRLVNMDLVYAQQARRILDRLVGFSLSGLLQRKISIKQASLSAGRVQSVVLRLVVEKEEEIRQFVSQEFFKIGGIFSFKGQEFRAESKSKAKANIKEARKWLEACKRAEYLVKSVQLQPREDKPKPPFTTSTLQQEASSRLGYSLERTMRLAQQLYENGFITYMRTDSTLLSKSAIDAISKKIVQEYGAEYLQSRNYKTKSSHAQEAHEAIRPTDFNLKEISLQDGRALYKLIYQRTLASQMSNARIERTKVEIDISTVKDQLIAQGDTITFHGYLKAYQDTDSNIERDNLLPTLKQGDKLNLKVLQALERHTQAPARYGENTLVKKMEELGIGRPATYSQTISTLLKRNYMQKVDREGVPHKFALLELFPDNKLKEGSKIESKGAEQNRLLPMDLGKMVTNYLVKHFQNIMDYSFTASIEKDFDIIAHGNKNWVNMVDEFYHPFIDKVNHNLQKHYSEDIGTRRLLGTDPESKGEVWAKFGRYGPMIQIGETSEVNRPRFASIPEYLSLETISLQEALRLFNLPKEVGVLDGEKVILHKGPYGAYAVCGEKRYALGKIDVYNIENQEVIAMVEKKRLLPRKVAEYEGEEVFANIGPFGPYITWQKQNFPLKKGTDVYTIDSEVVLTALQKQLENLEKRTLKTFPEIDAKILRSRRFGPVIKANGKSYKLPQELSQEPENLSQAEVEKIIKAGNKSSKKVTKTRTKRK